MRPLPSLLLADLIAADFVDCGAPGEAGANLEDIYGEGAGSPGWYVESWAHCDYSELPRAFTDSIGLTVWTSRDGLAVPPTTRRPGRGPSSPLAAPEPNRTPNVRNSSYRDPMNQFTEQDLAGSTFERVNLSGTTFREVHLTEALFQDVDLSGARMRAAYLNGVRMTGVEVPDLEIYGELGRLVVNGVDVVPLVEAELDRRMPARVLMRPFDAAGFREAFAALDRLWSDTVDRARALPAASLHEQVAEEWSFTETLRHLGFAHACWVSGVVLGEPSPWHPLDLPWDEAPAIEGVPWDRGVRPSLDEALALRASRRATVAGVLDGLTDSGLAVSVTSATPFLQDAEGLTVAQCLRVVINEEWEHRLYAERDLATLSGD